MEERLACCHAVSRCVPFVPTMCGQKCRWTHLPCARRTGGVRACHFHTSSTKRHIIQLGRIDIGRKWALYSSPFFLELVPDRLPSSERIAAVSVAQILRPNAPARLYAVASQCSLYILKPGDVIETYHGRNHVRHNRVRTTDCGTIECAYIAYYEPRSILARLWGILRDIVDWPVLPPWMDPTHFVQS